MKKSCIVIERVPNPFVLCYHTTAEVSESQIQIFERPLRDSYLGDLKAMGEPGRKLVEEVLAIDGVVTVSLTPYTVQITIGEAFEWNDISSAVIEALKRLIVQKYKEVKWQDITVEQKYDAPKWRSVPGISPFGPPPVAGVDEPEFLRDFEDDET